MICEKCGKQEATVFYRESVNGVTRELHLCADCAGMEKKGQEELFSFPLFSSTPARSREECCPLCGTTLSEIRKKGLFGCSRCYDSFASRLDLSPFIGAGYRGKTLGEKSEKTEPAATDPTAPLKAQLKEAVAKEEYERAAALRDEIRKLEGK